MTELELNIPASFRRFRLHFGLTKTAVASTLGIKPPSYEYETIGKSNNPTAKNLFKLATTYGVSTDYLLGLTDDPTPRWKVDAEPAAVKDATPEVQSPPASAPTEMTPAEISRRFDKIERALTAAGIELK